MPSLKNPYRVVVAFQHFAGKPLTSLDVISRALTDNEIEILEEFLTRIADEAALDHLPEIRKLAFEIRRALKIKPLSVPMLVMAAMPTHDEDCCSARQISAAEALYERLKDEGLDLAEDDDFLDYCQKATVVEQFTEALRRWEAYEEGRNLWQRSAY